MSKRLKAQQTQPLNIHEHVSRLIKQTNISLHDLSARLRSEPELSVTPKLKFRTSVDSDLLYKGRQVSPLTAAVHHPDIHGGSKNLPAGVEDGRVEMISINIRLKRRVRLHLTESHFARASPKSLEKAERWAVFKSSLA